MDEDVELTDVPPQAPPTDSPEDDDRFTSAWAVADTIPGWLTEPQGRTLWESVKETAKDNSVVLEIGSFKGRSTVLLGMACQTFGSRLVTIDPYRPWKHGTLDTCAEMHANVKRYGLEGTVTHIRKSSRHVKRTWNPELAMVFVDGRHDVISAFSDLGWSDCVASNGVLAVHDCFSSVGTTVATLCRLATNRNLNYLTRQGSLAILSKSSNNGVRQEPIGEALLWWTINVGKKILIRIARVRGRYRDDPY